MCRYASTISAASAAAPIESLFGSHWDYLQQGTMVSARRGVRPAGARQWTDGSAASGRAGAAVRSKPGPPHLTRRRGWFVSGVTDRHSRCARRALGERRESGSGQRLSHPLDRGMAGTRRTRLVRRCAERSGRARRRRNAPKDVQIRDRAAAGASGEVRRSPTRAWTHGLWAGEGAATYVATKASCPFFGLRAWVPDPRTLSFATEFYSGTGWRSHRGR